MINFLRSSFYQCSFCCHLQVLPDVLLCEYGLERGHVVVGHRHVQLLHPGGQAAAAGAVLVVVLPVLPSVGADLHLESRWKITNSF